MALLTVKHLKQMAAEIMKIQNRSDINQMMQKVITFALMISVAMCKIMYAFAIIRHGAKYSFDGFLTPPVAGQSNADVTPAGLRQLYNLGTYLRQTYINQEALLPQNFDNSVQFFSSSLQRTQMSANALAYGLYPLQQGPSIKAKVAKQLLAPPYQPLFPNQLITEPTHSQFALRGGISPIPVHPLDYILDTCKNINLLQKKRVKQIADEVSKLQVVHSGLIQKMKLFFKLSPGVSDLAHLRNLYLEIEFDPYIGLPIPQYITLEDRAQLKVIQEQYDALYYSDKFGRILATLPLQLMRTKLTLAASGKSDKKMFIVTLHSSSMWPILASLNLTSWVCIDQLSRGNPLPEGQNCEITYYASSLIVQVHQDGQNLQKFIKIKFNGQYTYVCERSEQSCPLQEFVHRLERTEQDYDHQCGPRAKKGQITQKV